MDNPATVPVRFYGYAVVASPTASFSFGSTLGATASASSSGPNGTQFYSTPATTAYLVPGKEYNVVVSSSGCSIVVARFQTTNGQEIYIQGQKTTGFTMGTNYSFKLRVEAINDITGSLAGKRGGVASSIVEDKPIWYIGLGTLRNGRYAGAVGFRATTVTSTLYNTSSLIYDSIDTGEVSVTRDGSGHITQIQSRDVVLQMDAYNSSGTSYNIRAYTPDNLVTPFITYTVESYASGAGVRINKVEDSKIWSTALTKSGSTWTRYDWQKVASAASPLTHNVTTTSVVGSTSTVTYGPGTGQVTRTKTYSSGELASSTMGSGQTTSYTYHTSTAGGGWPNGVATITEPTGNWVKYEYFNGSTDTRAGLISKIYRPWLSSPTTAGAATTGNCLLETRDYTTNYDGNQTAPSLREIQANGTTVAKTTWVYNWSYGTANSRSLGQIEQRDYSSSGSYLSTTTLTYKENDPNSFFKSRPHAITQPDGTKQAFAYHFGDWNPTTATFTINASGAARRILTLNGQASSGTGTTSVSSWDSWNVDTVHMVANLSTVSETVIDTNGHVVLRAENIYTGGSSMERLAATARTFDGHNLLTKEKDLIRSVSVAGGEVATTYDYDAGLLLHVIQPDGYKTSHTYHDSLQVDSTTRAASGSGDYPAVTQSFTYYGSNLPYTTKSYSLGAVTTHNYDSAGRPTSDVAPAPGGGTLTTAYSYPSAREVQEAAPTGATKITETHYDGQVKDLTGTGQVARTFDYVVNSTGIKRTVMTGTTTANGWTETQTDWLGRPVTVRTPQVTWSSGTNKVVRKTYTYSSTTGQLTKIATTDENAGSAKILPDHLFTYGNLGLLTREGEDVTNNGSLDNTSIDRITSYTLTFYKDTGGYNGWIRQDKAQIYRTLNNGSDLATLYDRHTRLTRFNNGAMSGSARILSDVVEFDSSGRASVDVEWADLSARTRTRYYQRLGASQVALTVWQDGYLKSDQSISGVTTTRKYNNGQGLLSSSAESTTNAETSYSYYANTNYLASSSFTSGPSTTVTTSYSYAWNSTTQSHKVTTTLPGSNVTYTEYNALGLPWRTWGNAAHPALYGYDVYGRRTSLTTWRTGSFTSSSWPSSPGSGDTTSWTPDAATGMLVTKTYANGSTNGYTYNARGQIHVRTNARGQTATHTYFDTVGALTGELKKVDYSGTTQDIEYTYTRFGALASVTDAAGQRNFAYRSDLQLNTETLGLFYGSRVLTQTYDSNPSAPGRPTGYSFNGNITIGQTVAYNPTTELLSSITGASGASSTTFTLGYSSGTDWVNSVTNGSYSRATPLVSKYNVIASATTSWSGTGTLGQFAAQYTDARGWRSNHDSGSSISTIAGSWSKLLNLGDGIKSTYAYNSYGELSSSPTPSWQNTAGSQSLAARNFGWSYDIAGNRSSETGAAATAYSTIDTNGNAWGELNQYEAITGTLAESTLSYDADGNMTQDGTWTYGYDVENRLISMNKTGQSLAFSYDYLGRRIQKVVTGTGAKTVKFLWNGWKLAAELASNGTTVTNSFIWGPDFSDAQGGAGGAGSLLGSYSGASALTYAIPDALGNITGYINSSGTISAAVEYSPSGRVLNTYGSHTTNPFGYSGQYTDWETGLVYYGLRYYNPKHGRFINRDPIEEAGGNNLYAFVGNAPTRGFDTLGLERKRPQTYWDYWLWSMLDWLRGYSLLNEVRAWADNVFYQGQVRYFNQLAAAQKAGLEHQAIGASNYKMAFDQDIAPNNSLTPVLGLAGTKTAVDVGIRTVAEKAVERAVPTLTRVVSAPLGVLGGLLFPTTMGNGEVPKPVFGEIIFEGADPGAIDEYRRLKNSNPLLAQVILDNANLKAVESGSASARMLIIITKNGLQHVIDRHTHYGLPKYYRKSKFLVGEDLEALIYQADKVSTTLQSNGRYQRIVDAGRIIGTDRNTGLDTAVYTVITEADGTLVTAYPGTP